MIRFLLSLFFSCLLWFAKAQGTDSIMIRKIFETALTRGMAYKNLEVLCRDYGKRLSGSMGAAGALQISTHIGPSIS